MDVRCIYEGILPVFTAYWPALCTFAQRGIMRCIHIHPSMHMPVSYVFRTIFHILFMCAAQIPYVLPLFIFSWPALCTFAQRGIMRGIHSYTYMHMPIRDAFRTIFHILWMCAAYMKAFYLYLLPIDPLYALLHNAGL